MTYGKTSRCGQHALSDEGWRLCSAIYFCCLVWPHPLNRMISRAHVLCELSGPPSGPELWTQTCCCAFMFEFKILLVSAEQRPGPSKLSRKQPLGNPKCSSRRKTPSVAKVFSSVIYFSLSLCHWAPNSWLSLVGSSRFESSFGSLGWISFWLTLWLLLEAEKLLSGSVKIRNTKAISGADSYNSGPEGRFSLGLWPCD